MAASAAEAQWGATRCCLPKNGQVCSGGKVKLRGTCPQGVKYEGYYACDQEDRPGDVLNLYYRLVPGTSKGDVIKDVRFMSDQQRAVWESMQVSEGGAAGSTAAPPSGVLQPAAGDAASGASISGRPMLKCERLLHKLTAGVDGQPFALVRLRGREVPEDVELYFCQRTFTALQARVKTKIHSGGLAHEYSLEPDDIGGKGGVYELKCERTPHHVQVKVQPSFGLQALLPAAPRGKEAVEELMGGKMHALLGLYNVLWAFMIDAGCSNVPLAENAPGSTRQVGKLAEDSEMLKTFLDKCAIFSRVADSWPPLLRMADPGKEANRAKLRKALLEVKMLLVEHLVRLGATQATLTEPQAEAYRGLLGEAEEECCAGGLAAQSGTREEASQALGLLICGSVVQAAQAEAWKVVRECVERANGMLSRVRPFCPGLDAPSMELRTDQGGVDFKNMYSRIFKATVEHVYPVEFLSDRKKDIQRIFETPDAPLRILCPSAALNEAIDKWQRELDVLLAETISAPRVNRNPRGLVGLTNPGDNLCATNSLLQLLFSAEPLRAAVLQAPQPKGEDAAMDACRLVAGAKRTFAELADPQSVVASSREVATVLHGGSLGEQQDSDELMHRLSSLVQDGLSAAEGAPFGGLQETFRRLFVGATCEVQVRRGDAATTAEPPAAALSLVNGHASRKQFLTIPIQRGNQMLTQALEDFTAWSSTGGSDVAWTQEQFRTLPPFLCFASRQVADLTWEESLNLTRFVVPATAAMQRDRYERSKALQLRCEVQDSLKRCLAASSGLDRAGLLSGRPFLEEVQGAGDLASQLRARLAATEKRIVELDGMIGDGFEEQSIGELFDGVACAEAEAVIRGVLGADTVKKLADLVIGSDGVANDVLDQLVQAGTLPQAAASAVAERLLKRWKDQRVHLYDVHAIVLYQGLGQWGHYITFIRQPQDGAFVCFDDEQVSEYQNADSVRAEIARRGGEGYPATVRMVAYCRRGESGRPLLEPLELPGPQTNGDEAEAEDGAKRRRVE